MQPGSKGADAGRATAADVDTDPGSPCIALCRIDERSGWCEGCLRSLDEIAAWGTMSTADKRHVWALLPQRRAAADAQPDAPSPAPIATPGRSA